MATNVVLTFVSAPAEDTVIQIHDSFVGLTMTETFKLVRSASGESILISASIQATGSYLAQSLNLDYNVSSIYNIVANPLLNTVTITANNPNSVLSVSANTTSGAITSEVTNVTPPDTFEIETITISEASTTPCDKVKLTIETNEQADSISSPLSQTVSTNPLVIDVPRQETITVSMVKDGTTITQLIRVPKLLNEYFNVNVFNTPSLAAISVTNTFLYTPLFTLEYSLDEDTWQSSNYFNGIAEGSHTVYIRDSIGCSTSLDFTVDAFSPNVEDYEAICEVSNLNPIRYKEDVRWSDTILKTPENTLSFEEDIRLKNVGFTQPFIKTDIVKTQIKTNYSTIEANIIDVNGTETPINVFKMSSNMGVTDVRDAVVLGATYNGLNYVSVKYSGGNIYDPITLADSGNDYYIGNAVPSWMNKDDYVNIQSVGWYKVLDIIFSVDAYVLVLNLLVSDFPLTLGTFKITSVYNKVDFERYEFTPDLTGLEGYYQVRIDISDDTFGTKTYLSEWLNIRDSHPRTKLWQYYNSENNEINFNTGFVGVIRIPYVEDMKWKSNTEQDIYVTDTNTVNLESKYRGFWEFKSAPLPTKMAEKFTMILLQDRLFGDTVNYLSEDAVESIPIGGQYQIKPNLVKSNYVFNSNSGLGLGEGELILSGTPLAINDLGGLLIVD